MDEPPLPGIDAEGFSKGDTRTSNGE